MMNCNCLDECNLLIYGTGGNGMGVYKCLSPFCNILGFIDKRAEKINSIFEKPVFTLQQISEKLPENERDKTVVIITIKNVFMHSDIAKELLKNGFMFLIYKPLNILKSRGNKTDIQVNDIYENIVEKRQWTTNILVPRTKEILFEFQNKLFISRNEDEVTTWVPVEILFNYKESYDYPGINMPLFFPLVELYKAFLGTREVPLEQAINNFYLYCGEWLYRNKKPFTEEQKESFLESRRAIFEEMQKMAEVDIDFFKTNAPFVEKDGRKLFLKSSGRNRVAFLIAKGFKYVPVRMSSMEYNEWCDMDLVHEKERDINESGINCFFAPYPNPYLVDYPMYFTDYQRLFLQPVANEIIKKIYLNNVVNEEGLNRVFFEGVEQEKKKICFYFRVNDDGIAEEYFKNIGFMTSEISGRNDDLEKILVIDDENYMKGKDILYSADFQRIYLLQKGNDIKIINDFEQCGYKLNYRVFESICRNDMMRGISFIKEY